LLDAIERAGLRIEPKDGTLRAERKHALHINMTAVRLDYKCKIIHRYSHSITGKCPNHQFLHTSQLEADLGAPL